MKRKIKVNQHLGTSIEDVYSSFVISKTSLGIVLFFENTKRKEKRHFNLVKIEISAIFVLLQRKKEYK